MKKIINGLRYDSEKAVKIGSDSYGYANDFNHWDETLYKTPRSNRFFLVGEGGARTKYATKVGQNMWGPGSDLIPLDKSQALQWCEEHLGCGDWEEFFKDDIQDA